MELHGFGSADYIEYNFALTGCTSLCFSDLGCYLRKEGETEPDAESSCQVYWCEGEEHSGKALVKCTEEAWLPANGRILALETGMQIRFGRSRYRVEEINFAPDSALEPATEEVSHDSQSFENVCRICLSGSDFPKNPLIRVCKCTGTMQWIHANCAEAFVLNKLKTSQSPIVDSYLVQPISCDLCLTEMQMPVKETDVEWAQNSVLKPVMTYLKLVRVGDPREFHYLHPAIRQNVTIGRARTCDLKLPDASISRLHATLTRTEAGFLLKDENSKFGTLVQAPTVLPLPYNKEVVLQIRQSLVRLKANRPGRVRKCCCFCCLKQPCQVSPRVENCVTEPNTKRHEELPLNPHFLFP